MTKEADQFPKLSMSSTKQEMLAAYHEVLKQLTQQREAELKPEKKAEEKKAQEVVTVADALSTDGVAADIANLKLMIGKMLTQLDGSIQDEVIKYQKIKAAIEVKQNDFSEIYDIEKSAGSLAAMIETTHQQKARFEQETAAKRADLEAELSGRKEKTTREIEETKAQWDLARAAWQKEKLEHDQKVKEFDVLETQKRQRDKETYEYSFKREQQLARDQLNDEKAQLEKELQLKREEAEKELAVKREAVEKEHVERERSIVEREKILTASEKEAAELRAKAAGFAKELDAAVSKTAKELTERLKADAAGREQLLSKDFAAERSALTARIEALEEKAKDQNAMIEKLSQQLEKSYEKVQDIAIKAIEGSSNMKTMKEIQQMLADRSKSAAPEKM